MIKIRRMEKKDVEAVYSLGTSEERFRVGGDGAVFWPRGQLSDWVKSKTDVLLVAEDNDKIVGYALSQYHAPTKKAVFENLHVSPEYRGEGVGSQLTDQLVAHLKKQGAVYICALVEPNNEAILNTLTQKGFEKGKKMRWLGLNLNDVKN